MTAKIPVRRSFMDLAEPRLPEPATRHQSRRRPEYWPLARSSCSRRRSHNRRPAARSRVTICFQGCSVHLFGGHGLVADDRKHKGSPSSLLVSDCVFTRPSADSAGPVRSNAAEASSKSDFR
jgi:hypothetical protein